MTPTRSEAIAAAKVLRQWCSDVECKHCFFYRIECKSYDFATPIHWNINESETKTEEPK